MLCALCVWLTFFELCYETLEVVFGTKCRLRLLQVASAGTENRREDDYYSEGTSNHN